MIEFTKAFVSNGKTYATLEEAQRAEIKALAAEKFNQGMTVEDWTGLIVSEKSRIIDILTTTKDSKPKARSINGGRKPRTPKPTASANGTLPIVANA